MAAAFHTLKVADVRRETPEAVSIAFAVPPELADDYRFQPGQHLTLRTTFDGDDAGGPIRSAPASTTASCGSR